MVIHAVYLSSMSTDLCVWQFQTGCWGINPYGCVLVGWGQAWPACWPAVSRFCINSAFLCRASFPGYMKWNCACWLRWGLLTGHFVTVKLCRFSICLAVMTSYSQVSPMRELHLDWDIGKTHSLHWCKEGGSGSVSAKVYYSNLGNSSATLVLPGPCWWEGMSDTGLLDGHIGK